MRAMEREAVITKWEELERELVVGWCGATAVERRRAALRELVAKQHASEGGDYELGFTRRIALRRSCCSRSASGTGCAQT
jgi:hypothetical protein